MVNSTFGSDDYVFESRPAPQARVEGDSFEIEQETPEDGAAGKSEDTLSLAIQKNCQSRFINKKNDLHVSLYLSVPRPQNTRNLALG